MRYKFKYLTQIRQYVLRGGIIAYPTEGCFGIGCHAYNYRAITQVAKLKRRAHDKGMIVIGSKFKYVKCLLPELSSDMVTQLKHYWSQFTSVVLPAKFNTPRNLIGKHNSIAIRLSSHHLTQQLCDVIRLPLVSTSANRSGCKIIKNYKECLRQFGNTIIVLPGVTGFAVRTSRIFDWLHKCYLR